MISTADFKKGLRILLDGDPYTIIDTNTQTPSARGAATLVKSKLRNLRTDQVFDKTFRAGEKFEEPDLERRTLQYLYDTGEALAFMDMESYEQFEVPAGEIGDDKNYLTEGKEFKALFFEGKLLGLDLPSHMDFEIIECEPGTRGDTARGVVLKGAVISTGMPIQVPLHIKTGDKVKIDTRTGEFVERSKG